MSLEIVKSSNLFCQKQKEYIAATQFPFELPSNLFNYPTSHHLSSQMDAQISSHVLLLFSLFLPVLLSVLLLKIRASEHGLRLPPGPRPLPIIGNIHNLVGLLPHQAFRKLSLQYGPIMHLRLGEIHAVIITSPEAAREVMKTHDITFATRLINATTSILTDGGKGILLAPYGEYWRQMRRICIVELLNLKRVQSFRIIRQKEVDRLVQIVSSLSSNNGPINLRERLEVLMNDITVRTVIGSKCKNQDLFLQVLGKLAELAAGFNLIDLFPSSRLVRRTSRIPGEAKRTLDAVVEFLDSVFEEHMERKACGEAEVESLLDVLLRIKEEYALQFPLTLDTIKPVISDMFGAGSETASTTVEYAMSELVTNPRVMKHAQLEIRQLLKGSETIDESDLVRMKYLPLVIKETLRLHPPAPLLLPRQCRETCRILGYDVPKGAAVFVNVWAIGRDPKYWQEPEEFKPERFINKSVNFGGSDFEFLPFVQAEGCAQASILVSQMWSWRWQVSSITLIGSFLTMQTRKTSTCQSRLASLPEGKIL